MLSSTSLHHSSSGAIGITWREPDWEFVLSPASQVVHSCAVLEEAPGRNCDLETHLWVTALLKKKLRRGVGEVCCGGVGIMLYQPIISQPILTAWGGGQSHGLTCSLPLSHALADGGIIAATLSMHTPLPWTLSPSRFWIAARGYVRVGAKEDFPPL